MDAAGAESGDGTEAEGAAVAAEVAVEIEIEIEVEQAPPLHHPSQLRQPHLKR